MCSNLLFSPDRPWEDQDNFLCPVCGHRGEPKYELGPHSYRVPNSWETTYEERKVGSMVVKTARTHIAGYQYTVVKGDTTNPFTAKCSNCGEARRDPDLVLDVVNASIQTGEWPSGAPKYTIRPELELHLVGEARGYYVPKASPLFMELKRYLSVDIGDRSLRPSDYSEVWTADLLLSRVRRYFEEHNSWCTPEEITQSLILAIMGRLNQAQKYQERRKEDGKDPYNNLRILNEFIGKFTDSDLALWKWRYDVCVNGATWADDGQWHKTKTPTKTTRRGSGIASWQKEEAKSRPRLPKADLDKISGPWLQIASIVSDMRQDAAKTIRERLCEKMLLSDALEAMKKKGAPDGLKKMVQRLKDQYGNVLIRKTALIDLYRRGGLRAVLTKRSWANEEKTWMFKEFMTKHPEFFESEEFSMDRGKPVQMENGSWWIYDHVLGIMIPLDPIDILPYSEKVGKDEDDDDEDDDEQPEEEEEEEELVDDDELIIPNRDVRDIPIHGNIGTYHEWKLMNDEVYKRNRANRPEPK